MASRLNRLLRPSSTSPALSLSTRAFVTSRDDSCRTRRRYVPARPHEHSKPSAFIGSWKDAPSLCDPREAQRRLAMLRRDYDMQVRECRKKYIFEVEQQRQERYRRMEARREAILRAKEERKAVQKEANEARAAKHLAFQDELRQTLVRAS